MDWEMRKGSGFGVQAGFFLNPDTLNPGFSDQGNMKTLDWMRFLELQQRQHGKALFRVAELANVTGHDPHALNVELCRLVRKGVLARYATGVYGLPGRAAPEQLVAALDEGAYITGAYAMYCHNMITQRPEEIACFTNRRHNRSRERKTPFGRLVFIQVVPKIHCKPAAGVLAPPEQAFCDFVHLILRQGLEPSQIVTFSNLAGLSERRLSVLLKRYPPAVGRKGRQILALSREG